IARLQQQRAIEHERARLGTVLEATSDFVAFSDPEGSLLFINDAGRRMVGLTMNESIHTLRIADFYPRPAREEVVPKRLDIAKREGLWSGETALQHRVGRQIPVSQVIVAHKSSDGRLDFLSTIARDISERIKAEDELRTANARLHRLSAHLFD